ncbi:MAG: SDR family oxidoreductase [Proteobacteria bacterium]|nr:SDR family oxidoreductase [Burkholderiales bacterium]
MDLRLSGKRVLVTGASQGIGLGIAQAFAAEGCHLALAARDPMALAQAAESVRAQGAASVTTHSTDLGAGETVRALAAACDPVDILVNNAGSVPQGTLDEIDEARWRTAWDLKVFGYINLTREVYRAMAARGSGVIVNIVGVSPMHPSPKNIAGAPGNAALLSFTQALGTGSLDHGVRVVAINPGATETQRQVVRWKARAQAKFGDEARWRELTADMPLGRLARVDEVADVAVFLASARASYVSGTMISVDGGAGSAR